MVNPISDNKILPSSEGKAKETGKQGADKVSMSNNSGQGEVQETQAAERTGDSVNVESAKQIYNGSVNPAGEGIVANPDEAKALASQIARQFADNVVQAFSSQAGSISKDTAALLQAAPA